MNIQEDETRKQRLLEVALPILQALLASGQYITDKNDREAGGIIRYDHGKEWQEDDVFVRRHTAVVIEDALDLAKELLETIDLETEE